MYWINLQASRMVLVMYHSWENSEKSCKSFSASSSLGEELWLEKYLYKLFIALGSSIKNNTLSLRKYTVYGDYIYNLLEI